jgi:hypothetical protein
MLAVVNWHGEKGKLYLFDVAGKQLVHTVALCEKSAPSELMIVRQPAFSPGGKWVAVITQAIPGDRGENELKAEDVPQPRIHVVEAASGMVRETLVAPQGFTAVACFSPDGKTLATGGNGKVLLWDLTRAPTIDAAAPRTRAGSATDQPSAARVRLAWLTSGCAGPPRTPSHPATADLSEEPGYAV